jgi:hypothetical protein
MRASDLMKLRTSFLVTALLVSACSPAKEVARVAIPETPLEIVVVQDDKKMYRYRIFQNGVPVSEERVFSGYSSYQLMPAAIAESAGVVKIFWAKQDGEIFLEFDRQRGQIVRDSNMSAHPPVIEAETRGSER